ncbi:hypothetical protein AB0K74_33250 [Streptomyces sp. NPDC056159]|uniref:hypothetical protein n=1 Tax=unclassified Streptomyces TaxID=2593676 RepID=UPI0034486304
MTSSGSTNSSWLGVDQIEHVLEHFPDRTFAFDEFGPLGITTGAKKGQHPSPATVMRMLREHDEQTAAAPSP